MELSDSLYIVLKNLSEKNFPLGLTFDDVLLVPQYSQISSRKKINLRTNFSRRLKLGLPIVSANMDTVTEANMAIAMAMAGGLGIIHRFLTIEQQVAEARKVKRSQSLIISDPITTSKEKTLGEALAVMRKGNTTGLPVCDEKGFLEGILTHRDVRFKSDPKLLVADLMTGKEKLIVAPADIAIASAIKILDKHKIEKLPLVDKKWKLVGLITAKDFLTFSERQNHSKDDRGRFLVGAAVGVKDGLERADKLVSAGTDVLVIDIAHGHHKLCLDLLKTLKRKYGRQAEIVAGNVATADGIKDLILAGADAVKVGIGPGAACSTRIVAGAGVPQLTAILKCSAVARKYKIPIIADGGVKNSGDLAKAIAAGASTVMIGSLFAGTKESPGEYFIENGSAYKIYRGLASFEASPDRERTPEGISNKIFYKGEVKKILNMLLDGLQSGMSYSGAESINRFWQKAKFVRITESGMKESLPRI